ncbi:MAG: DNA polymerase III subunit delta' [Magnetococcales bacterium]|nr:DNA polymerase III subunit delta' [Magnetococcales bacterium]
MSGAALRPLSRIHGQVESVGELVRLLREGGRMPHALLFHGPSGVGKATAARALAAALYCRARVPASPDPCGQCPPCRRMAAGSHPDFVLAEVEEGKTQVSIEQIREITRFIALTALEEGVDEAGAVAGGWKMAVVDDASRMNDASANALLKTLEEPPPRSLLILITNRPGRLLPTIRSRCRSFRFAPLSDAALRRVLNEEMGGLNESALVQALELAEGSAAQGLAICGGDAMNWLGEFRRLVDGLPRGTLAVLCEGAALWSEKERYVAAALFLQGWLRKQSKTAVAQGGDAAGWLALTAEAAALLEKSAVFNLNRALTLETLFIRIARFQGAGF